MRRSWIALAGVLLAFVFAYAATTPKAPRPIPPAAPSFEGVEPVEILRVIDADTIRVAGGDVIRLVGIQAPEEGAPHATQSTNWARNLLNGEAVWLVQKEDEERDVYNRRLCYVYRAPDGLFVNLEAIRQGYAESYRRFPCRFTDTFNAWEAYARRHRKGLWKSQQAS